MAQIFDSKLKISARRAQNVKRRDKKKGKRKKEMKKEKKEKRRYISVTYTVDTYWE